MLIKILRQCATPLGPFEEGQVAEIPDETAQKWIKSGLASVTDVTREDAKPTGVTLVTNTGNKDTVTENQGVTPVTDKKEKERKQIRDRVARCREKKKKGANGEI